MKLKLTVCLVLIAQCVAYAQTKKSIPTSIVGAWEVWIPGAVTYHQKESKVYQVYEAGSAMSRLQISADGNFQWGNSKSKLTEVRPWYAEENKRYFSVKDLRNNVYDFWYKESADELIFLFGGVGGHAATGIRIGDKIAEKKVTEKASSEIQKPSENSSSTQQQANVKSAEKGGGFKVNDKVLVLWSGGWYKAKILEEKTPKYLVHYDGWGSLYDEWVTADRIKKEE